jgi:polyisoprenoid-binding protein YceI
MGNRPNTPEIGFKVKHMMFTTISGNFKEFDASIEVQDTIFENAKIEFSELFHLFQLEMQKEMQHLLSADFLIQPQFPEINLKRLHLLKLLKVNMELTEGVNHAEYQNQ